MGMENDALRALRAPIEDRIDLRHRILDALVDRGGKLRVLDVLGNMVDRIDGLIWIDGDMRQTRLRYEIFNTCLRKGINLAEVIPTDDGKSEDRHADLLDGVAALLNAHGTGAGDDFGGHPDFVDVEGESTANAVGEHEITEFMHAQNQINDKLVAVLERLSHPPLIMSGGPAARAHESASPPLTENADEVKAKRSPLPGTPGGKGKKKP